MSLDSFLNIIEILQFVLIVWTFLIKDQVTRKVTMIDEEGKIHAYEYKLSQLGRERDEKSVLSSHGHFVRWDETKQAWVKLPPRK